MKLGFNLLLWTTHVTEEHWPLLDALKAQEQSQRDRLHPFLGRPVPVEKDW